MPYTLINPSFPLVAGGVTYSVAVTDMNQFYEVTGTQTITVDNVFQESGTPVEGMVYVWKYKAIATYSGGAVKFHGTALSTQQALKQCIVIATYTGGAWDVDIIPDLSESNVIENSKILSLAYTKLTGITRGNLILGDVAGNPSLFALTTDGAIPIGNGTDPTAQVVSGVITLSKLGVTAFVAGAINNAALSASLQMPLSKLINGVAGQMIVVNAGLTPTYVAPSGAWTISDTGVATLGSQVVSVSNLLATIRDNVVGAIPVLFTTGNMFADGRLNEFTVPYDCEITFGFAEVTTLIEATNNATAQLSINGVGVTNGTITFTLASVIGTQFSCTPTGANTASAGDKIGIMCSKVTSGGAANIYITLRRT